MAESSDNSLLSDLPDASIRHLSTSSRHKNKETYIDALMEMFGSKFKIDRKDLYTIIDVYKVVEEGLSREVLLKVIREIKVIDSYKSKMVNKQNNIIQTQYNPNPTSNNKNKNNVPTFNVPSSFINVDNPDSNVNSTPMYQLVSGMVGIPEVKNDLLPKSASYNTIPLSNPILINKPSTVHKSNSNMNYSSSNNVTNRVTYSYSPTIPNIDEKPLQKDVIKCLNLSTPDTHILTYPQLKMITLSSREKLNYAGTYISATACSRYNLHEMPYILLVVNKKYKIPIKLTKQNNQFYTHNILKGPMHITYIEIELYDFMNNPLNVHLMPTEIFHVLFETATQ
jgi:hypothetical protein